MKRRTFLTNLAATAALPLVPFKALAGAAPAAATAASMEQPYLWASFVSRVHNKASPAMLQRLLKLDEGVAKQVYAELIKNNVVTAPNAYGLSQAVSPYPQPGLSYLKPTSAPAPSTEAVKNDLNLKKPQQISDDTDDSPPVNQEVTASQDDDILNESLPDTADTDRQA